MKLYNYWISFKNAKTNLYERTDHERDSWKTTKELAEDYMLRDIEWCNSTDYDLIVEDYGIEEQEFDNFAIEGIIGDNGNQYEDMEITVGNTSLYTELYQRFKGTKIRMTIKFLEEGNDTNPTISLFHSMNNYGNKTEEPERPFRYCEELL